MITIQDTADQFGRKTLKIDSHAKDMTSYWDITLQTSDLPDSFVNTTLERLYDLSIVEADMRKSDDHPQVMFLPVELIGVSRTNECTRYHYKNKLDTNRSAAPQLDLYCYIDKPAGEAGDPQVSYDLNDPYLRIQFALADENGQRQEQASPQGLRFESSQFSDYDAIEAQRMGKPIQDTRTADLPSDIDAPRDQQQRTNRDEAPAPELQTTE